MIKLTEQARQHAANACRDWPEDMPKESYSCRVYIDGAVDMDEEEAREYG